MVEGQCNIREDSFTCLIKVIFINNVALLAICGGTQLWWLTVAVN